MSQLKTFSFRATENMISYLKDIASRKGSNSGHIIRNALANEILNNLHLITPFDVYRLKDQVFEVENKSNKAKLQEMIQELHLAFPIVIKVNKNLIRDRYNF